MAKRSVRAVAVEPAPESSRDRILDAAILLYARYGVDGVSLSQLADDVGLHKSTLFYHFASKGEIAEAALRRAVEPISDLVEPLAAAADAPDLDQLVGLTLALDDHFAAEPAAARFLLRALVGPGDELENNPELDEPDHPVNRLFLQLGTWFERARKAGVIRRVRVRHAIVNLLGIVLLYPAIAEDLAGDVFATDPRSSRVRRARRDELAAHMRAAYGPIDGEWRSRR